MYKNPPYPIFYDVVYHSYALVPMLASNLYYSAKFSSTVLTSFITGTCKGFVQYYASLCSVVWLHLAAAMPGVICRPGHTTCINSSGRGRWRLFSQLQATFGCGKQMQAS